MQRICNTWRCQSIRGLFAVVVLCFAAGCTSVTVTGTPRTGTEQLLLTGTWDDAIYHVDFSPMAGRRTFLDATYVTVVDKDWIISSIRRSMLEQGVLLENNKDKAEVIVEAALWRVWHRPARSQVRPAGPESLAVADDRGRGIDFRLFNLAQLL